MRSGRIGAAAYCTDSPVPLAAPLGRCRSAAQAGGRRNPRRGPAKTLAPR